MTNEISKEKLMTTKEVASVLGVSDRTIREHARKLGLTQNGKQTFLDEKTVTVIKKQLEMSSQIDVERSFQLPKTMLEKQILINQALQLSNELVQELQAENMQLKTENAQLSHALEYDKVAGWKPWNHLKKEIQYKGNFQKLVDAIPLIKDEDFAKKVMADDCYPTTLISLTGEEKIIDYKETVLDEAV